MKFIFATTKLERLYTKEQGARRFSKLVIEAFFDVMGIIATVKDERDLRNFKSLHYEKLKDKRSHQLSLALNGGFRLILEREEDGEGMFFRIISIKDYH